MDKFGNIIFDTRGSTNSIQHPSGQSAIVQLGVVFADDGTEISAFNNVSSNACFDTDCHGVSFTAGGLWINNDQVDKIIKGDNLKEIERSEAMVGDVVVYRDKKGNVEHSMTISAIDSYNSEILVKGLGGMETEVSETSIDKAWKSGATQSIYRMPNEFLKEHSYVMPKDKTM